MKTQYFVAYSVLVASLLLSPAHSVQISNIPPYLKVPSKENVMLVVDDSGSMDYELMYTQSSTVDGVMWWNHRSNKKTFFESDGTLYDGSGGTKKYTMLFPNGVNARVNSSERNDKVYDGKRMDDLNQAIPPINAYGFARSPDFNGTYYNPNLDYKPWPSVGGYTFADSPAETAKYDPLADIQVGSTGTNPYGTDVVSSGNTTDLTQEFDTTTYDNGFKFFGHEGMVCEEDMSLCSATDDLKDANGGDLNGEYKDYTYYLPTVYLKQTSGTAYYPDPSASNHTITLTDNDRRSVESHSGFIEVQCFAATGNEENYFDFTTKTNHGHSGQVYGDADAFAPDGSCLRKYEIRKDADGNYTKIPSSRFDEDDRPLPLRNYEEELQNFANWFTYNRRRHQISRGAIAEAMTGLNSFYTGQFWFNDRPSKVEMYDMADESEKSELLKNNYEHVISSGSTYTLIRKALKHAGEQFQRTVDPIVQYSCQQNFSLLFTDGYSTTGEDTVTGFGNADANKGAPFQDHAPNTLADIAYTYQTADWEFTNLAGNGETRNIPTECDNPDSDAAKRKDCNIKLHMNTSVIGFGALGDYFGVSHKTVADAYNNPPNWPLASELNNKGPQHIDDLYHAAVNGKGEARNADSPEKLKKALESLVGSFGSTGASASRVGITGEVTEGDGYVGFRASYDIDKATGDVNAVVLGPNTVGWSAADLLENRNHIGRTRRSIITYSNVDDGEGVPFRYINNTLDHLNPIMQLDLATGPDGNYDADAGERMRYLHGDRSNEVDRGRGLGSLFRKRESVLGPIINSAPVYVGAPKLKYKDIDGFGTPEERYSTFKTAQQARTGVVYVGANDAMLHAFSAATGEELFGYIPSFLASTRAKAGLHYLTEHDYEHRYYVDGKPRVVDVYTAHNDVGGSLANAAWRTMLVGSAGYGGKGVFLLDITDPGVFDVDNAAAIVEWEFTHDDLGFMKGTPFIVKTHDNKWSVIFGNGYNSKNGKTGIFVLNVEGGMDGEWTATDYKFIELSSSGGGIGELTVVDVNSDGIVDRVFGGDLEGNMWVVDITATNPTNWASAYLNGTTPKPLFQAVNGDGEKQPITTAPLVIKHPTAAASTGGSNLLVSFGTGKFLSSGDALDTSKQSFYVLHDNGSTITDRTELAVRTITTNTEETQRNVSGETINWGSTHKGWYMDLPENGERIVTDTIIRGDVLRFVTNTPISLPCQAGGSSWFMAVPPTGRITTDRYFDTNGTDGVTQADEIVQGKRINSLVGLPVCIGEKCFFEDLVNPDADPVVEEVEAIGADLPKGRMSWRQLINEN